MARDFIYIDDIVDGVVGVLDHPPAEGGHEVYNIGDSHPVGLMEMFLTLENALGREAVKIMRLMQPAGVTATYADVTKLHTLTGFRPKVSLADGLAGFVEWWRRWDGRNSARHEPLMRLPITLPQSDGDRARTMSVRRLR